MTVLWARLFVAVGAVLAALLRSERRAKRTARFLSRIASVLARTLSLNSLPTVRRIIERLRFFTFERIDFAMVRRGDGVGWTVVAVVDDQGGQRFWKGLVGGSMNC